ncbi:MAG: hypothetical protein E6L04_02520 [Thaumarchaeota archaeon]|nr:MAG: hypothetical protein E6L04_02520 [Nitrososphaerota archaeon]
MLLPLGREKKGPIALDPVYYITTPLFVTKANQTEYQHPNIPVNPLCIMVKEMVTKIDEYGHFQEEIPLFEACRLVELGNYEWKWGNIIQRKMTKNDSTST